MLSKLHWQKRTNRKSQQSFEGHSLSPQPSPELQPEGASASPPSRRPGFLSRVRSQRFSTVNLPANSSHQATFILPACPAIVRHGRGSASGMNKSQGHQVTNDMLIFLDRDRQLQSALHQLPGRINSR
ncbi:hypothetical protein D6C90_05661 [Aureobasidium pullulans]|uniref:Uncharacterized protein n=1 Tax=Aureobasidium pullulans TaxID=5580 RepID=A0A4S9USA9_AURPU|nr:hypothetical protein D6C90_05661 [Aureobasidium pullulans]